MNCTGPVQLLYWRRDGLARMISLQTVERLKIMVQPGYKQFCPVAMAAELLCSRWTMVLLRELVAGTTRFNDLRRGVPKM
jgi:DNA-binding HxlR family transcriptional regulator